jgi:2,3-bisphosphoglycerate-independent phosphoglycerate mutase
MCEKIREIKLPGTQFFIETEKEHRAALVLRGGQFSERISETDPQKTGVPPLLAKPLDDDPPSIQTAEILNRFTNEAHQKLREEHPANGILLRGFALFQKIPTFQEIYGLHPCAIAGYPMYRGLASLVGMEVIETESGVLPQLERLREVWGTYDFYFVHIKYTDSRGEDGNFPAKVRIIEEVDKHVKMILDLKPDVFVVTADHSTPASLKAHSWHPVPMLLRSKWSRSSGIGKFGETQLLGGTLGIINSIDLMPLVMAHSGKLAKFGA